MLYDYQCKTCGLETEEFNRIDERNSNAPLCCGQRMEIVIKSAPYGYVDRKIDYICPVTNQHVSSKRQRREIMAKEGLVSAHDMVTTWERREQKREEFSEGVDTGPAEVTRQVNDWAKRELNL